jgi:hypothetical protein
MAALPACRAYRLPLAAPQDGPRISVAHALAVRYAKYCRAHDCDREPAIRTLWHEDDAGPFRLEPLTAAPSR